MNRARGVALIIALVVVALALGLQLWVLRPLGLVSTSLGQGDASGLAALRASAPRSLGPSVPQLLRSSDSYHSKSPGDTVAYLVPTRGTAIIGATVSRQVA